MHMIDEGAGRKVQIRRQFNELSHDYDAGSGCFAYFGARVVANADIQPGQHVLDVASGRGAVLFPAAEQVGRTGVVVGIDLADEMASALNDEGARRGRPVRVLVMDAEQLAFSRAAFDRVLCGFGVMFFPDHELALGEFRRVLKPGGLIALSTWRVAQNSELEAVLADMGMKPPKQPGWITEPQALESLLTRAGFYDVRVKLDSHSFRYADADEYWQQARGTGMRRALDALDHAQMQRAHAALAERIQPYQRNDGIYLSSTALIAVGNS